MRASTKGFGDSGSTKHAFVDVDPSKCVGCGICELVCSFEKSNNRSFNPLRSRIKVLRLFPGINMAMTCRLCDNAPCVRVCRRNALMQSAKNGVILVDNLKCDGCGWCIEACKNGSIGIDPVERNLAVCDLCEGRKGIGVYPGRKIVSQACIEWCPEEALDLVTRERVAQKNRESAAVKSLNIEEEK